MKADEQATRAIRDVAQDTLSRLQNVIYQAQADGREHDAQFIDTGIAEPLRRQIAALDRKLIPPAPPVDPDAPGV